jgi:pseudouridine synthase
MTAKRNRHTRKHPSKSQRPKSAGRSSRKRTGGPKGKARSPQRKQPPGGPEGKERIQKYLAHVGIASRRAIEEMVEQGRVQVNGKVVTEHPIFVDPKHDEIRIDGRRIRRGEEQNVYYLLNKPRGVMSTNSDPSGRPTVIDLLGDVPQRVYCVGRLDADSTGLILLTNDGELTQHLTHPSHEVPKTYVVNVQGEVGGSAIARMKKGLHLDGRRLRGAGVKVLRRNKTSTLLEVTLREGRNREIRRMLAKLGFTVRRLRRTAIGPVTDRGLKTGNVRELTPREVQKLWDAGND